MSDAKTRISFRIRKIDADLAQAIDGIDSDTLSELCRDGLRLVLGIRTTKRVEVTERTLVVPPAIAVDSGGVPVASKPAVFIPQKLRKET